MKPIAHLLLAATALALSAPALAGEEPLYKPAPDWVQAAQLPTDKSGPPILLFDDQRRIEQGRLWSYSDRAIRIDNPQVLTAAGTISASWLPDKGDLIVHRVAIIRDGQEIDVLAQGAKFDVLRRERQLEMRTIDGARAAILPVPGLRVGDVLRITYSVTTSDQALKQQVQAMAVLPAEPFDAKLARVRFSWPKDAPVKWRASGVTAPAPVVEGDYDVLEVKLPLAKRADMPDDAPVRYRMPAVLQAGTFSSWQEVSRLMTPLFATAATIAPGSALAREVDKIKAGQSGQLERAVAALRLVQDQVSYLANGMAGGNYIPQSPAETWDKRYGDCKAKTMLLLAMLREMGIDAEATLVSSSAGDAVPTMLPMPGAFDHVIVHATIGGTQYWLDGTSFGASLATAMEVPDFHYALPLRAGGADLIAMTPRPQTAFDRVGTLTFDNRAGLDVPALYEGEWTISGASAAPLRAMIGQAGKKQIDDMLHSYVESVIGDNRMIEGSVDFDAAANTARIKARGVMAANWKWERGQGSRELALPSARFQFRPDRSRAAWKDIPVALPQSSAEQLSLTLLLPADAKPYTLDGQATLDQEIAHARLHRAAHLDGPKLTVIDTASYSGGELAGAEVAGERSRAARLGSLALTLRAPDDVQRVYNVAASGDRKRYAPVEAAFTQLIAAHPDDAGLYGERAQFRVATLDRAGALADLGKAIELEPTGELYLARSNLLQEVGRLDDALADADKAYELYPSVKAALARAEVLPYLGRVDEAVALLKDQTGDADERETLALTLSELDAQAGRKQEGLKRLDDFIAQRPGDADALNAKCWYEGIWNVRGDDLPTLCTEAVEKSKYSSLTLDSRAMGYYRLGRYNDALKDLDAALLADPEQTPSLFMRGVVRRQLGDHGGDKDIHDALVRQPSLERFFGRYGIKAS